MTRPTIILDAGHGGIANGVYMTAGKRSPFTHKGMLYEGVFNRDIVRRIAYYLDRVDMPYVILVPEHHDISLHSRCNRVNFNTQGWPDYDVKNAFLVSIHANAGGGRGFEVFTSPGKTDADYLADLYIRGLQDTFKNKFQYRTDLSDGDLDKEARFKILTGTLCPAILTENLFMDTRKEYELLMTDDFRDLLSRSIFFSIKMFYEWSIQKNK